MPSEIDMANKEKIYEIKLPLEYNKIILTKEIKIISNAVFAPLSRCVYNNCENKLIVTDTAGSCLKVVDMSNNTITTFSKKFFNSPSSICINKKREIFFNDQCSNHVIVINDQMNFVRKFDVSKVELITHMLIDFIDPRNILYITDRQNDKLYIYDSETGLHMNLIHLDSPLNIAYNENNIYITSLTEFDEAPCGIHVTRGQNCIYVLDKKSFNVINKIQFQNWLNPNGLYVDENSNILTTACQVEQKKLYENYPCDKEKGKDWPGGVSNKRYLFIINQHGKLIRKRLLFDNEDSFSCVHFNKNKLFILYSHSCKIFTFE